MKHLALALALGACTVKMPSLHVGTKTAETHTADIGTAIKPAPTEDDSGPALDPEIPPPDPDPSPAAFRDGDGDLHGPGGPVSDQPADCGPAHNHCLRANGWFASGFYDGLGDPRQPVFKFEGHWYTWRGKPASGGTLYRTKPATAENITHAREVFVFLTPPSDKATLPTGTVLSQIPTSEKEALTAKRWSRISVYTVDAKAGTFVADDAFTYQIAAARVAFDPKEAE